MTDEQEPLEFSLPEWGSEGNTHDRQRVAPAMGADQADDHTLSLFTIDMPPEFRVARILGLVAASASGSTEKPDALADAEMVDAIVAEALDRLADRAQGADAVSGIRLTTTWQAETFVVTAYGTAVTLV